MAFTPYATDGDFQAWLGTEGVSKTQFRDLARISATRAIDEYCQRHFWQDGTSGTPVARTFEATSCSHLQFGPFNDLSAVVVPVVATDEAGDGTFETTWAASDYQLLPFTRPTGRPYTALEATAGRRFPYHYAGSGRRDRVRVTGVWGWDAVPDDVKQACLIKAAKIYTRHQSHQGFAVGIGDFGIVRISQFEDPEVVALLAPYRKTAVLVA